MDGYSQFLAAKQIVDPMTGLDGPFDLPDAMFPHQRDISSWMLRRGRAALFAGTGLGKSLMSLAWAQNVAAATGEPVLYFNPLAVSAQMVREAAKFGIVARQVADQSDVQPGINITNYQKFEHFQMCKFGGVALGESSVLKNHSGHYRTALIDACKDVPFRIAETATPAPNDFMELGNHAEFLGVLSYTDMLATFFTHDGGETQKWRLKGHAEDEFWRWMASWAVMLRKPSDLGYPDDGYDLPPLTYYEHTVSADFVYDPDDGTLFPTMANTMQERLGARRSSITERVAKAAEVTPSDRQFFWFCNLNAEAEAIAKAIPGAVNLHGGLDETTKEKIIIDFIEGRTRVVISKPSLAGFGLNLQCCADAGFVGLNDSFEQYFQAVRRFWRFGQSKPVNVHIIAADTEGATVANIRRKEIDAERMAGSMLAHMADLNSQEVRGMVRNTSLYAPKSNLKLPSWLGK